MKRPKHPKSFKDQAAIDKWNDKLTDYAIFLIKEKVKANKRGEIDITDLVYCELEGDGPTEEALLVKLVPLLYEEDEIPFHVPKKYSGHFTLFELSIKCIVCHSYDTEVKLTW